MLRGLERFFWLCGEKISVVEEYRYLGCVVNEQLNCTRMVEERAKARAKALSDWLRRCKMAVGELRGKTFIRLLEMLVDSVLLYGAEVWGSCEVGSNSEISDESGKDIPGSGEAPPQGIPSV